MQGRVKWFDEHKGFGFIEPDDRSREIFVHGTAVITGDESAILAKGARVEFDLSTDKKGRRQAANVRLPIPVIR